MQKATRVARFFSFLFFLVSLTLAYSYLPEQVSAFADQGKIGTIERQSFFYIAIAVFMLINITMTALIALIDKIKYRAEGFYKSVAHKEAVSNWFKMENIFINLLISFGVIYIGIYNNSSSINPGGFGFLIYFGLLLVLAGFFWLLKQVFFFKTPLSEQTSS